MMDGMGKRKLTQKEREEAVTKGYVEDQDFVTMKTLKKHDYRTEAYFKKALSSEDFATKEYVAEAFAAMDTKFQRYIQSLMEDNRHYFQVLMEGNNMRFERIERHVGLEPWTV